MNTIFLDTVGLVALWNRVDQWHLAATAAFQKVTLKRRVFTTTSFILLECGNTATRRDYRNQPNRLREKLEICNQLIFPTHEDRSHAWEAYMQSHTDKAGIVDHVSFQIMRRLGIIEAFTNDKHFEAAGFKVLF